MNHDDDDAAPSMRVRVRLAQNPTHDKFEGCNETSTGAIPKGGHWPDWNDHHMLDARSEDCDHQNTAERRRWEFVVREA